MAAELARVGQKRLLNGNVAHRTDGNDSDAPRSSPGTPLMGSKPRQNFSADASIVLIGIRGCGKRSLGFIAAAALRRRFITEDYYFQQVTGVSRQDYLRTHGSEQFHKEDVEISRKMLTENKTGCVIDCGLGSLTSSLQEYLKVYCTSNPVIHIVRDIQAVKDLLKLTDRAARMLESADPSHRRCSNFEFFNIEDESDPYDTSALNADRDSPNYAFKLQKAQTDFSNFVRSIATAQTPISSAPTLSLNAAVEHRWYTHALQVELSVLDTRTFQIKDLEGGGDIVEVLVERWDQNSAASLSRSIAAIRRDLQMPVMVSPALVSSSLPLNDYFLILRHALRLNVDFVAVDMTLENAWLREFISRCRTTRVLGAHMHTSATEPAWQESRMSSVCDKAILLGIDMLRFTAYETSRKNERKLELVVNSLRAKYASKLSISAFNVGQSGRTSQLFNPILTPVTHELVAPMVGMLDVEKATSITSRRAFEGLFASFTLNPLHYYVLGANVTSSLSPAMHAAAYTHIGLPHDYIAVNVTQWEDIEKLISSPDFGGASIAQPWKVKVTEKIGCLSEDARAIGAINTLIPLRGESEDPEELLKNQDVHRNRSGKVRAWFGANTDWISIHDCLRKNISPRNTIHAKTTALIIGAGGMARSATYALLRLGCRNIFIYNRTVSHAQKMIEHFQTWLASQSEIGHVHMQVIESTRQEWPADFAQPTIVVSCVTAEIIPGEEGAAMFKTPAQWLRSESGGTAVEQAYYINTPFVNHLKEYRVTSEAPWNVVDGYEVLHTQAVKQFEIMTNRIAPRNKMREALLAARSR